MKFSAPTALTASALSLLALAGCSSHKDTSSTTTVAGGTSTSTASGGTSKTINLAFVTNNASDYWTLARKGVEKAEKEFPDVNVEFKIPPNGTAADQKQIIDDLLSSGVTGFAISPDDPANQTQMLNDAAQKATVITQDSDAPNSDRVCYIGTDNQQAGKEAGEMMRKALPGGGDIMIFVGSKDAQNAKDRIQGVEDALKGSNIHVIDVKTDNTDHAKAKSNVSESLVTYPNMKGAIGIWSYNGPAILNAVKEAGKVGSIKIVAFDEEDETLAGVKAGQIYGDIVQQPYEFGYDAIKMLRSIALGDKSVIPASKLDIIPTLEITQGNVDAFIKKVNIERGR